MVKKPVPVGRDHVVELVDALDGVCTSLAMIEKWAHSLACMWARGGRLLVAGNGGSAAQAQHLTAELVGRFHDDRPPLSAIALTAETSSLTAIGNDFGADEIFARQVEAHARPGDVVLLMSTSGASPNLLAAAARARQCGVTAWALTGARPNPLAERCKEAFPVASPHATIVQEAHLVVVHLLCAAIDAALAERDRVEDRATTAGIYAVRP